MGSGVNPHKGLDTYSTGATVIPFDLWWSECLLGHLLSQSSSSICFAPGRRSQPLIHALLSLRERHPLRLLSHFDERGLAFAAMGLARAEQKPVILLTTSGSAVANLLPGLLEARAQRVPILVVTADRPPHAHFRGSAQTCHQPPLLAGAVTRCFELPAPTVTLPGVPVDSTEERCVQDFLRGIAQEVLLASSEGPVHINCPFEEPFHGTSTPASFSKFPQISPLEMRPPHKTPTNLSVLFDRLAGAQKPLVTLGAHWHGVPKMLVDQLHALGAVILPDILSQWRLRSHPGLFRETEQMCKQLPTEAAPDLWIHLGDMVGPLLSKQLALWLQRVRPPSFVVQAGEQRWDPSFVDPERSHMDPILLSCSDVRRTGASSSWQSLWRRLTAAAALSKGAPSYEAQMACTLWESLPSNALLYVGNSMPIRHFAEWAPLREDGPRIWCNRGLAGIDGNLASALGWSWGSSQPLAICVGDLTALHDLNSLAAIRHAQGPVLLQILNNSGGDIFRHVTEKSVSSPWIEEGFVTPHPWLFRPAAEMFGWEYGTMQPVHPWRGGYLWEPPLDSTSSPRPLELTSTLSV